MKFKYCLFVQSLFYDKFESKNLSTDLHASLTFKMISPVLFQAMGGTDSEKNIYN